MILFSDDGLIIFVIMDSKIQKKLDEYRKLVNNHSNKTTSTISTTRQPDSLSQVIRSKKDADDFMAELESAFKRAK